MRSHALALIPLAAPWLLSACASRAPSALAPPAPTPAPLPSPPPPAAHAETIDGLELLDAGSEPRRTLPMHPTPGSTRTVDLTFSNSTQVIGAAATRVRRPHFATKMHVVARLTLTEIAGTSSAWHFEIVTAEVLPWEGMSEEFLKGVETALVPARGATGRFLVKPSGRIDDLVVDTAGLGEQEAASRTKTVRIAVSPFSMQRPDVALGAGAHWRVALDDGARSECELRPGPEVFIRCRGGQRQEGSNGSVDMDVEGEVRLDPASGFVTSSVTRSLVKIVGVGDDGQPLPMESHVEMRSDVR